MVHIEVRTVPNSEQLDMRVGVEGFRRDVEIEMSCVPAAMVQAYIQRMQDEGYSRSEIRLSSLKLCTRIESSIKLNMERLVKEGKL